MPRAVASYERVRSSAYSVRRRKRVISPSGNSVRRAVPSEARSLKISCLDGTSGSDALYLPPFELSTTVFNGGPAKKTLTTEHTARGTTRRVHATQE